MNGPTKALKKELAKLNDMAYRRELSLELEKLLDGFKAWKNGAKDIFDLVESVHEFHEQSARKLYEVHATGDDHRGALAFALAEGTIKESEVSEELRVFLGPIIEFYRRQSEDDSAQT